MPAAGLTSSLVKRRTRHGGSATSDAAIAPPTGSSHFVHGSTVAPGISHVYPSSTTSGTVVASSSGATASAAASRAAAKAAAAEAARKQAIKGLAKAQKQIKSLAKQDKVKLPKAPKLQKLKQSPHADIKLAQKLMAQAPKGKVKPGTPAHTVRQASRRLVTYATLPKARAPAKAPAPKAVKVAKPQPVKRTKAMKAHHIQKAFQTGQKLIPSLDKAQTKVAARVLKQGVKAGATHKELVSAMETGIQESGMRNLKYGDADSQGFRQERTSIYGVKHATSVKKSAQDYFSETASAGRGKGQTAGELAQSVQRSAYPGAYDPHAPQARQIVKAYTAGKSTGPSPKKQLHTNELFYDPGINLKDGQPTSPVGGHTDHVHFASSDPRSMLRAAKIAENLGATVTENPAYGGVAPVHVSDSYHYRSEKIPKNLKQSPLYKKSDASGRNLGQAIDIDGSPTVLAKVDKALASMSGAPTASSPALSGGTSVPVGGSSTGTTSTGVSGAPTASGSPSSTQKSNAAKLRAINKNRKKAAAKIGSYRTAISSTASPTSSGSRTTSSSSSSSGSIRLGL